MDVFSYEKCIRAFFSPGARAFVYEFIFIKR
jgi:hypothetical protein